MNDDLISRQVAIDALCEEYCNGHHDCKYYPRCENLRWIQELPSAQPETRWISCEKRLPTQEGEYLVCDHNERVFIAKFWTAFGEWGDKDIIAWQKAPEPYRKETEDAEIL